MYIINNQTLFLYFNGENTIVLEDNQELLFRGNVLKRILNDSCIYYGSSYLGRLKGSKSLLTGKYKLPIIISEKNNIIFFPIKENKYQNIIWFNFNMIQNYNKISNYIEVDFKNKITKEFMASYTIFNNQMFKCSRLWLIYLTRC